VIDRYSDVALFFGLLVYYARGNHFFYLVLVAFVMVSSVMVSYTRARAESLIGSCKVGFMERPERVVLVIIGALFARWGAMAPVLWVLAVLSTITIIHRIAFTYQQTRIIDLKAAEAAAAQQANAASKTEGNKPQPAKGKGPQQIPSFN
jgi:CDP-diacylglycerol--glycerol-3-phosphate 3-phosphatidyltransferase